MAKTKVKSHRGAAKRLKRTGSGKIVAHHAYHSHLFLHKNAKRKRRLRRAQVLPASERKRLERLLPR